MTLKETGLERSRAGDGQQRGAEPGLAFKLGWLFADFDLRFARQSLVNILS